MKRENDKLRSYKFPSRKCKTNNTSLNYRGGTSSCSIKNKKGYRKTINMITIHLFISAPKSRLNHRIPPIYNQNCLGKIVIHIIRKRYNII
jgi:hypothetical protein